MITMCLMLVTLPRSIDTYTLNYLQHRQDSGILDWHSCTEGYHSAEHGPDTQNKSSEDNILTFHQSTCPCSVCSLATMKISEM